MPVHDIDRNFVYLLVQANFYHYASSYHDSSDCHNNNYHIIYYNHSTLCNNIPYGYTQCIVIKLNFVLQVYEKKKQDHNSLLICFFLCCSVPLHVLQK